MTDEPPRRRTLSLKPGAAPKLPLEAPDTRPAAFIRTTPVRRAPPPPPPAPPPAPTYGWKCKPCGAGFDPPADLADDVTVRCPGCNARIGLVGDFKQVPPPHRLRARPVKR
jgi:DNA-directed RNA polymerase subunit RPC12/RpoP